MTPATSVSFFRPEFNAFLYAPIGADGNEMPLSVLSALTRLNLDPWKEAAELSELPKDTATHRLARLIAQLPGGQWTQMDSGAIAERLIEILPRSSSKIPLADKAHGLREIAGSAVVKALICIALVAVLIIAANRLTSSREDYADEPAFGAGSPPQTSPARSRQ